MRDNKLMAVILIAWFVLALEIQPAGAAEDQWSGVERIVAIGDVHGDYDRFVDVLQAVGLVDEDAEWTGGKTHLVQTGDIVDRGPDSRKAMDLLMQLEREAERSGGYVHALIGNHEAMNIYGDLRYVAPEEFAAFRDVNSRRRRTIFYRRHIQELRKSPPPEGLPDFDDEYREKWMSEHPLGYFKHRFAFGPNGEYGKWIQNHNTVIKINDSLFLHGGLGPKYSDMSIREINETVREELEDFDKLRDGMVIDSEGPLWYRGLASGDEDELSDHVETLTETYGVERIVVGHTPQPGAVIPRFGGRVILIDVGLSAAYGGNFACLVIEDDETYALHRGEKLKLPDNSGEDLLRYLKQAAALDPTPSPLLPLIQRLETKLAAYAPTARPLVFSAKQEVTSELAKSSTVVGLGR